MSKGKYYSDLSLTLPTNFEWSCDFKVSSNSGSEDRVWLTPTEMSGDQPSTAIAFQIVSNGGLYIINRKNRVNNHPTGGGISSSSANTYHHFILRVNGTTATCIVDDTNLGTMEIDWLQNYSSYWFAYSFWKRPSITGTVRNNKLKLL